MNPDETTNKYPVCPQCGCNTIVGFHDPKTDYRTVELYCANGLKDCSYRQKVLDLTTPIDEPRYNVGLNELKYLKDYWLMAPHGLKTLELLLDDAIKFKEENPDK